MIFLLHLLAHSYTRKHLASMSAKVTSTAIDSDSKLKGKYCAIANAFSRDKIQLKSTGNTPPMAISKLKDSTKYLCISQYNTSASPQQAQWFYINVNIDKQSEDKITNFAQNHNFTDFGTDATPVQTTFQKNNKITAGYVGPINRNLYLNSLMSDYFNFEWRIYQKSSLVTANDEATAVSKCGSATGVLKFKSKYGMIYTVLLSIMVICWTMI